MRVTRNFVLSLVAAIPATGACACAGQNLARVEAGFTELRGTLASAETTFTGMRGRYAAYRVRLVSSSGLVATGRLLDPRTGGGLHPAALVNDGRELDSRALEYLPVEFGDVVVLSLDYPSELPYEIRISQLLFRSETLKGWARRIPAMFSLGREYLARRTDVDSARVAIVATSFAVPFAVTAAALDEGFGSVGLIYGAGDFAAVLAANLDLGPKPIRALAAWVATRPLQEFDPERYVGLIAPRPLVMVNGVDDPQMPRSAVESLYAAAGDPKSIVWLRTGHLMPTDSALIRVLVDTTLARMPILRTR